MVNERLSLEESQMYLVFLEDVDLNLKLKQFPPHFFFLFFNTCPLKAISIGSFVPITIIVTKTPQQYSEALISVTEIQI